MEVINPMKFCPECNNLLYPREDKERKILLNACRTCNYTEAAENNCVYRNELRCISAPPVVLRDAYADPTLPRVKGFKCPICTHPKVAFFVANPMESLARTYACCNPSCGHNWRDEDENRG
ncbi:DNA-directed RNA polymerases II, IV and V subunit 9A-like [Phalaenopsis equestris]|uniref:DNA-directed RNA polymerases II, IV and V subunit 9A-like n=1 Tax=Phalaenopsis equestris TaxID=78828 RepID=UPI0009E4CC34|nr:DNA-directed RNA polymerases II, IV and V subunit 9A-like [Phalaenopsis equestris]